MSEHIKVEESYVKALIENAAWDLDLPEFGSEIVEGDKKGDKSKDKPGDKGDFETGARKGDKGKKGDKPDFTTDARKGDKGKGKDKDDKPDFTTDQRKGDKSKTHPGRKDFEDEDKDETPEEMAEEGIEAHTCPLCESTLDEELSDEKVLEHVAQIQAALTTLEEGGDDDGDVEPTNADLDAIENENENKKTKKESKVMKKVKELKAAAKGK
jgi:hypothetical protein|tara:strand:+ start:3179 stop:3814 length:636 start_codon:yes stop_codon:yes gene_type:complete